MVHVVDCFEHVRQTVAVDVREALETSARLEEEDAVPLPRI